MTNKEVLLYLQTENLKLSDLKELFKNGALNPYQHIIIDADGIKIEEAAGFIPLEFIE